MRNRWKILIATFIVALAGAFAPPLVTPIQTAIGLYGLGPDLSGQ